MYAWEDAFLKLIGNHSLFSSSPWIFVPMDTIADYAILSFQSAGIRNAEIQKFRTANHMRAGNMSFFFVSPALISFFIFGTYQVIVSFLVCLYVCYSGFESLDPIPFFCLSHFYHMYSSM